MVPTGIAHLDELVARPGAATADFTAWEASLRTQGFDVIADATISEIAHVDSLGMVVRYDPSRFTRLVMWHEQFHVDQHFRILAEAPELFADFTRGGSRLSHYAEAAALRFELRQAEKYASDVGMSLSSSYVDSIQFHLYGGDGYIGYNLNRLLRRIKLYPESSDAKLWKLVGGQ